MRDIRYEKNLYLSGNSVFLCCFIVVLFFMLTSNMFAKSTIHLRSRALTVPSEKAAKEFKMNDSLTDPLEYIANNFKDQGEVVVDYATDLMWKKGREKDGSKDWLLYKEAQDYIKSLNSEKFAGYNDWRLPTVNELLSIMEETRSKENEFTDPILRAYSSCWSSDMEHKGREHDSTAWVISFNLHEVKYAYIYEGRGQQKHYICAVRSVK